LKIGISKNFDWQLFATWFILVVYGIIIIFSASTVKIGTEVIRSGFWWKQIIFFVLSLISVFLIIRIPANILDIFTYPTYFLTILLLLVVFFLPSSGINRWISLGRINFQPSELAKIIVILVNARILAKKHLTYLQMVLKPLVFALIPFILIIQQPDLGTGLVLLVSYCMMLLQAGFPPLIFFILVTPLISILTSFYIPAFLIFALLLGLLLWKKKYSLPMITFIMILNLFFLFATPVIWRSFKPYQQKRILTFLDPSRDPLNSGYQVIQAKIAIGSGQLTGKGFMQGTQKNMNFLPEHHTDFVFSVISEELGFVGSASVLLLFLYFFIRIIKNLNKTEIFERKIAITGIFGFLFFQALTNIGMNIGLMPTTGIPLPFFSYGGSNLLINSIAVALVLKYGQDKDH